MKGALVNTGAQAASMTDKVKIGIIGEDDTDVECLKVLIKKIKPDKFDSRGRGAGGGGNMFNERKMFQLSSSLSAGGCQYLIIVHDLDRDSTTNELNDLEKLRQRLKRAAQNSPIGNKCIVIPIEELEAWLLSSDDHIQNPQSFKRPKEYLKKMNRNYRTSDNAKIAEKIDISKIWEKCPSFRPFQDFIKNIA
jgi:hypothetical protein